ncbi:MAG TPA: TRAP transporter large permease subunit, partial [Telluria sp.]|nr:TRAP transporter large permease subunit [Telluria sp.]
MEQFIIANIAPIMFGALVIFLLSGFPVAFALAANGLLFGFVGIELGLLNFELLQALPNRIYGIMGNDTLLAIPFFTFMGLILERSGMAEDLLDTIGQLFGPIRGGVAFAVVFVGALLAATTGVVAASVISMGLISLPVMLRYGYDKKIAAGVIAASGTLAQIIPPSLVLIVMADQLGRSVGDMYRAAFAPGLLLTALYAGYIVAVAIFKPKAVPALPPEARNLRQADGSSGVPSLLVLLVLAIGVAFVFGRWWEGGHPNVAADELGIFAAAAGIAAAFVGALANRFLKLNLLSR